MIPDHLLDLQIYNSIPGEEGNLVVKVKYMQ